MISISQEKTISRISPLRIFIFRRSNANPKRSIRIPKANDFFAGDLGLSLNSKFSISVSFKESYSENEAKIGASVRSGKAKSVKAGFFQGKAGKQSIVQGISS